MLKLLWFILNFWLELCAAKYRLHVWWAGPLNLADISVADFILFCSAGNRIFVYFVTDSCVDFKESVELMRHRGLLGCGCVRLLNASAPVTGSDNLAAADTAHAAARQQRELQHYARPAPPAFMLCRKKLRPPKVAINLAWCPTQLTDCPPI